MNSRGGLPVKRRLFATVILVAASAPTLCAWAEGDASKGELHYATCQPCHGIDAEGNQSKNAPRLVGLQAWYLVRQINNFRSGIRGGKAEDRYGQEMADMAKALPDEQSIEDVAAYIGTLDAPPASRTETSGDPARGEEIFHDCIQCHGTRAQGLDSGSTTDPRAPRLAGQDDWYLIRQLKNFQAGIRGALKDDKEGLSMRIVAKSRRWSDQDIKDVVAYIKERQ